MIERELERFEQAGADACALEGIKEELVYNTNQFADIEDALEQLESDIYYETRKLLRALNRKDQTIFNAISTSLFYVDHDNNTELKISCIGSGNKKIDDTTLFDVSSITKLYTLLLAYRLVETGHFSFNDKVSEICPLYKNLRNVSVADLMIRANDLSTERNIAKSQSFKRANSYLRDAYQNVDGKRRIEKDLGIYVLGDVMKCVFNQKNRCDYSLDGVMEAMMFEPLRLRTNENTYRPGKNKVVGNGCFEIGVSDMKTRALGGQSGAAGLFATSRGLVRLSSRLFVPGEEFEWFEHGCSKEFLKELSSLPQESIGIKHKHHDIGRSIVPREYSDFSFAIEGENGSVAIFDPGLAIHNNILVDPYAMIANPNRPDYAHDMGVLDRYREFITQKTLLAILLKKHYEEKTGEDIPINKKYRLG